MFLWFEKNLKNTLYLGMPSKKKKKIKDFYECCWFWNTDRVSIIRSRWKVGTKNEFERCYKSWCGQSGKLAWGEWVIAHEQMIAINLRECMEVRASERYYV